MSERIQEISAAAYSIASEVELLIGVGEVLKARKFVTDFCIASFDIEEEQKFDDNNYFTSFDVTGIVVDKAALIENGGLDYALDMLEKYGIERDTFELDTSLDEIIDYIEDSDFIFDVIDDRVGLCTQTLFSVLKDSECFTVDTLDALIEKAKSTDVKVINTNLEAVKDGIDSMTAEAA